MIAFAGIADPVAQASSVASRVDALFIALTVASGLLVLLLVALNLTFLIRYRRGSSAPRGPLRLKQWKLEAGWIAGTTVIFLGFFGWGAWLYLDMQRPPPDAEVIDVVGRQWMWDIRHPGGRREFNTLHVPLGRAIRLRMRSEDVIHSFYVPSFRVKQDLVPGKTVSLWFEPTRTGVFHLFCAEYCGTQHSGMVGQVVVQPPEDHAAWLASGTPDDTAADRGRRLLLHHGCSGCHAAGSVVHAPPLEGLAGKLVPLASGGFARADEAYLRDSILLPKRDVVAGYEPIMPSFQGQLSEGELNALITYLKENK